MPHAGERLKAHRRAARMTQKELGRLLGRVQQEVSYWEHTGLIPVRDLERLAHLFRLPVDAFATEPPPPGQTPLPVVLWTVHQAMARVTPQAREVLLALLALSQEEQAALRAVVLAMQEAMGDTET